jgi:hypothetical protein
MFFKIMLLINELGHPLVLRIPFVDWIELWMNLHPANRTPQTGGRPAIRILHTDVQFIEWPPGSRSEIVTISDLNKSTTDPVRNPLSSIGGEE